MELEEIDLSALVGGAVKVRALDSKDGTQKKVKLGSKARKLLKLQKQQGQKGAKHATFASDFSESKKDEQGVKGREVSVSAVVSPSGVETESQSKKRKRKGREKGPKRNHKSAKEISERDLPEREDMELENLPSFEDVDVPSTNDSKQKKVKLGSKARKLLKLQKGLDKKHKHISEKEISEDDLRKREDMELERLENLPSFEDVEVEEMDMSAWARLRLHPLLMKALMKLKFSKPTPIQEACIGAAAFQGKDVIGAAETGSGKTLAFGLPILQRLLDDQEKHHKKSGFDKASKKQSGGPLRALIITPTRELALQVCDHLRAVAQFTNANVVPIVGGMALQKQQRLLGYHPQLVVGTPGRLWELMNAGEKHLLDVIFF